MATITPNARTWTLRFKHHTTTILLHADPIQTFSSLKADLLAALQQTHPSGQLNNHQIPQNSENIVLAKPIDINDLSQGWERIAINAITSEDASDAKGKGRASTGGASKGNWNAKMTDCPQGAGLRDGGVVAFKFRGEDEAGGVRMKEGEGGDEDIVVLEDDRGPGDEEWDVVAPTIDETYAEQDAEEAGGLER